MSPDLKEFWQPPPVAPLDQELAAAMRGRIDGKAKPPGSLGRIEDLAVQLGMIRHPEQPRGDKAVLLVFAADHGLTEEGVSQYPSAVTVAMVMTYLAGRASANAFAAASNVTICVVDAGVAADLPAHANLIAAKIRMGTANAARDSRKKYRTRNNITRGTEHSSTQPPPDPFADPERLLERREHPSSNEQCERE